MPGMRPDQQALYLREMYSAEREGYTEVPTMYDKIFKVVQAKKTAGDKSYQILGAGDLKRHTAEGEDIEFKSPIQGWTYYTRYWTYSDGLTLTKESIEDTTKLGNLLKDLAATWGRSVRIEKETMAATVFNNGGDLAGEWVFNGTHVGNADPQGDLLYDGFPLFNLTGNDRSSRLGGTYFNSVAGLALNPANFETLYNRMTVTIAFDERDRIVENVADTLLVESGAQRFAAERIINTEKGYPSTQLNDENPYYKIVDVLNWRYLSDASAFYVGKRQQRDFQFHERQGPEIRFFRDEMTLGYKASINVRMGVWIKTFRAWCKGGGSFA